MSCSFSSSVRFIWNRWLVRITKGVVEGLEGSAKGSGQPVIWKIGSSTDAGKGLVTGLCSDVARTKGPILRGLAARAPDFHNGAASNLSELLDFYGVGFDAGIVARSDVQGQRKRVVANIRGVVAGGAESLKQRNRYGGAEGFSERRVIVQSSDMGNGQRASIERLFACGDLPAHLVAAAFPSGIEGEG